MAMDGAQPRLWPGLDITGDGRFSVDDLGVWAVHLLFLPGDAIIAFVLTRAPALAAFLQLGADDYGSTISRAVSVVAWLGGYVLLSIALNAIRNLDRTLTSWIAARIEDIRRTYRVTRRRVTSWIGLMRSRRRDRTPAFTVSEVELERVEAAILRCFADVGEMRVLAADEVAKSLELSLRQVRNGLARLLDYRLIQPAFGTDEGQEAHHITQAGQIYLLEH